MPAIWEKIYDISQKQQLAPMIYQQIFSNESFQNQILLS